MKDKKAVPVSNIGFNLPSIAHQKAVKKDRTNVRRILIGKNKKMKSRFSWTFMKCKRKKH